MPEELAAANVIDAIKTRHLDIIERYGGKHGGKAIAAITAAQVATPIVKAAVTWMRKSAGIYTIAVANTDDIYPDLHEWVLKRLPAQQCRAMVASTDGNHRYGNDECMPTSESDEENERSFIRLRYDDSSEQKITINGYEVMVNVSRDDASAEGNKSSEWRRPLEWIKFSAKTLQGRDAILTMIEDVQKAKYQKSGPPPLFIPSRWGGSWNKRNDLPPRTLESVILKEGQIDRLVRDLEIFLASEKEYDVVSQPWHRGYLFWGSPGTGKTSIARALANHFSIPMYYLPLGDLDKDADLMSLVSEIKPKSILLLEDVDVFHAMTKRNDDNGMTIAGMLNALDGVWTPHGLITIMTTNNREAIDDALIRAGRVDVDEEFTSLDAEQAARLCKWICSESWTYPYTKFVGKSPADLIKALRRSQQEEVIT
jgi:hypothetical protein